MRQVDVSKSLTTSARPQAGIRDLRVARLLPVLNPVEFGFELLKARGPRAGARGLAVSTAGRLSDFHDRPRAG